MNVEGLSTNLEDIKVGFGYGWPTHTNQKKKTLKKKKSFLPFVMPF
jgi:hypothetical protein